MLGVGIENFPESTNRILVPTAGAIIEMPFWAVVRVDSAARCTVRSSTMLKDTHQRKILKDTVEDPVMEAERGERKVAKPPRAHGPESKYLLGTSREDVRTVSLSVDS